MEHAALYLFLTVSALFPLWLLSKSAMFTWRKANVFPVGSSGRRTSRIFAALSIGAATLYLLYAFYAVYGPWLTKSGEATHGIVVLFGPTIYGLYAAAGVMVVGLLIAVSAKRQPGANEHET